MDPDPNRFANGIEAIEMGARLDQERAILEITRAANEAARASLTELERQVQDQEATLRALKTRRDNAAMYADGTRRRHDAQLDAVAAQRRFFHPIRKTPLEILGRIFEYALPHWSMSTNLGDDIPPSETGVPFRLAVVCRRWRGASLTSPRAWSCVDVDLDKIRHTTVESWRERIICILSRSSVVPIDIFLTRQQFRTNDGHLSSIVQVLLPAMQRCVNFRLSIDTVHPGDYLLPLLSTPTPKLLKAWMLSGLALDGVALDEVLFRESQLLQKFVCSAEFLHYIADIPSVKRCATATALASTEVDDLAAIASKMPNLEYLNLESVEVPRALNSQNPPTFQKLQELRIEFPDGEEVFDLAHHIKAPRLHKLTLVGALDNSSARIDFAQQVCAVSLLSNLHFTDPKMEDIGQFVELVTSSAKLKDLVLEDTHFTRPGLRSLCHGLTRKTPDGKWCNPALTHIEFIDCTFAQCDEADVIGFVQTLVNGACEGTAKKYRRRRMRAFIIRGGWDPDTWPGLLARIEEIFDLVEE